MEVNNFSLALPGLVDYLVIRLNRLKVPKWYLIQRASVSWLELVWLIIQSEQGWTGLTLGKSGISVTCVNKFNLNENILTLHSAQAQGLASVVTMNSKTAPSDRARRSRDDWADWRSDSLQWTSGVSQSLLRAGRGRMWTNTPTLQHSNKISRCQCTEARWPHHTVLLSSPWGMRRWAKPLSSTDSAQTLLTRWVCWSDK